jgi:gliding motility-associated-like protein
MIYRISLIIILLIPLFASAQKEANTWYFGHKAGLDFNTTPAQVLLDGENSDLTIAASVISDKNGNLIFYTDGRTAWNNKHEVMENGRLLMNHTLPNPLSTIIVPIPGSNHLYYIFNSIHRLDYYVVDMSANGGRGRVTEMPVILLNSSHRFIAATGSCVGSPQEHYWLASGRNPDLDLGTVYLYKISKDGVNTTPVISRLPHLSGISNIKFSPSAKKIAMAENYLDNSQAQHVIVADFNFSTGQITNPVYFPVQRFPPQFNMLEFSPDSKSLYYTDGAFISQIDLSTDPYSVLWTIETVNTGRGWDGMGNIQLAPDGNIYLPNGLLNNHIAMIRNPNSKTHLAERYIASAIDMQRNVRGLPRLVNSFLSMLLPQLHNKDTLICSVAPLTIGPHADSELRYQWHPATHLSNANTANPVFQYNNTTGSIQEFSYVLTAWGEGSCSRTDTVRVRVQPAPPQVISGSRSVCPGVKGVSYSVPDLPGYSWQWQVEGGQLDAGQYTSSIVVDWGPSNNQARVLVQGTSTTGCGDISLELPVRINVELIPEIAQGPVRVCYNQLQGHTYTATPTTGSVYTWHVSGGAIKSGQGSSQVSIDWQEEGRHQLWVQEYNQTIDTVCFGISERYEVVVYRDSSQIHLDYISTNLEDDSSIDIQANARQLDMLAQGYALYRRPFGHANWEAVVQAPAAQSRLSDGPLSTTEISYEYKLAALNSCNEPIESTPHRSIVLKGEVREAEKEALLTWNEYEGWPQGISHYEVWHKADAAQHFTLLGQTPTAAFRTSNGNDGFAHYYRIKAVDRAGYYSSWSNLLQLEFTHPVSIPNVFTPNGDGVNDTFYITNLEMYPDNELTIYNRWGQEVYVQKGYRNTWSAEQLPVGLYYYAFKRNAVAVPERGWLQLLR